MLSEEAQVCTVVLVQYRLSKTRSGIHRYKCTENNGKGWSGRITRGPDAEGKVEVAWTDAQTIAQWPHDPTMLFEPSMLLVIE